VRGSAAARAGVADARLLPLGVVFDCAHLGRVPARDDRRRAGGSGAAEVVIFADEGSACHGVTFGVALLSS
jgi:hypothetical protein